MRRRSFLQSMLSAGLATPLLGGCRWISDDTIMNPCLSRLPESLANHALVRNAWQGINPRQVWDTHVHLLGRGDNGDGTWMNPGMLDFWQPILHAQYRFYTNAACVEDAGNMDEAFLARLRSLLADQPAGVKLMLLAFDHHYDEAGQRHLESSAYYTGNRYAAGAAVRYPRQFEWIASIHPYRGDALDALDAAAAGGARAVKWLPPAMGMDPASPLCVPYYRKMVELDLPLLVHSGEEKAVHGANTHEFGNPLLLRAALGQGVKVIMAHCATMGEGRDLDRGAHGPWVDNFDLFQRLMGEVDWEGRLFGDISAINLRNRDLAVPRKIITTSDWHPRLINGSDYPLPGVFPLYSLQSFVDAGLIEAEQKEVLLQIRRYNPLVFDFVLKRCMQVDGQRLPASIFETRAFFEPAGRHRNEA